MSLTYGFMTYTADQVSGMLWAYHQGLLELKEQEVKDLELLLIMKYEQLTFNKFNATLFARSKDELIEFFRENSGESPFLSNA